MKPMVTDATPRTEPDGPSLQRPDRDPVRLCDGIYAGLQEAMEFYPGGITQLAENMSSTRSDAYYRIRREPDQRGNHLRAFVEHIAFACSFNRVSLLFAQRFNPLIDLEPPVPARRIGEDEIGRAWLTSLAALPPGEREGRINDMAAAMGVRPEYLKMMAGLR